MYRTKLRHSFLLWGGNQNTERQAPYHHYQVPRRPHTPDDTMGLSVDGKWCYTNDWQGRKFHSLHYPATNIGARSPLRGYTPTYATSRRNTTNPKPRILHHYPPRGQRLPPYGPTPALPSPMQDSIRPPTIHKQLWPSPPSHRRLHILHNYRSPATLPSRIATAPSRLQLTYYHTHCRCFHEQYKP